MRRYELIITAAWMALAVLVCILSLEVEVGTLSVPGPGMFPFVFAVFLGGLALLDLVRTAVAGGPQSKGEEWSWRRPVLAMLFLVLYSLILRPLGYLPSTFILFFFLWQIVPGGKREWRRAVFGASAAALTTYGVFDKLLQIPLPRGILGF